MRRSRDADWDSRSGGEELLKKSKETTVHGVGLIY